MPGSTMDFIDTCRSRVKVVSDEISKEELLHETILELSPEQVEDPTFLFDLGEVADSYQKFREMLPNVEIFYAVKCNSNPIILKLLVSLGSKFDCATQNEIKAALEAGALPDDIIFANTIKYLSHMRYAETVGVNCLVFDDVKELEKIKRSHRNPRLVLRIAGDSKSLRQPMKFGARSNEFEAIFEKATELGLQIVGISFHVGSFKFDKKTHSNSIAMARQAVDMASKAGHRITILDLGGGFPSPAIQGDSLCWEMARAVQKALKENFPNLNDFRLMAEPGYAIVKSCGTEIFTVIGKKERRSVVHNGKECEIADFMINDGIHCSMFDVKSAEYFSHVPRPLSEEGLSRPLRLSALWGHSMSSDDMIRDCVMFPDVDCGEKLYVGGRGSYGLMLNTTFNGYGDTNVIFYVKRSVESVVENCVTPDHHENVSETNGVLSNGIKASDVQK